MDIEIAEKALGAPLYSAVRDLRRVVRSIVRRDWPATPLSPTQVELLRVVRESPGIGVGELATNLHVAPNTVSTIVGRLVRSGLLNRLTDPADARAVRLELTPDAIKRLSDWRHEGARVIENALRTLDPNERAAIDAALPALELLVSALVRQRDEL